MVKNVNKRLLSYLILVFAAVLLLTPLVTYSQEEPEYTFYYISHGGPADPWWGPVIRATQDAAKKLGVKVIFLGPEKYSIEKLVNFVESAIDANPDGIIVTITNYKALDEPLRRAIEKGIPVIAVNVPDPRPPNERIPYLGYVGNDEYMAGYKLAERSQKEFEPNKPKRVVVAIHKPGHVGLELRAKGVKDFYEPLGVPVDKLDITPDPTKATEILRSYLKAHPDTELIITLGPLGAHPALKVLEEMNLFGKVKLATHDVDEVILEAIKEGKMICAISQQPYMQGYIPVVWMYLHVKYGFIPPEITRTGPAVIDISNIHLIEKQIATTGGA